MLEGGGRIGAGVKKNIWVDYWIFGEIVIIGLAEMVHLITMVLGWTFERCSLVFMGTAGFLGILWAILSAMICVKAGKEKGTRKGAKIKSKEVWSLWAIFFLLVGTQLFFVCRGNVPYRQGDMMVETVESFLSSDHIYQVNPMTGQAYVEGIPARLKILCLPTLYASLCRIFGLKPTIVVYSMAPVMTLIGSYMAYYALGCCFFPQSASYEGKGKKKDGSQPEENVREIESLAKKRICFLIVVAILMWIGTYFYVMDGFQVLFCGWRGTAIRNGVLLPWLLSACLRKKWGYTLLCVLAEACIVWTFYGMGVCLIVVVGMILADIWFQKHNKKLPNDIWHEK